MTDLKEMIDPLTAWYRANKRDLPWRREVTPYRVWISEIMLQQTRVEAVKDYFLRFTAALPDAKALAEIPEQQRFPFQETGNIPVAVLFPPDLKGNHSNHIFSHKREYEHRVP